MNLSTNGWIKKKQILQKPEKAQIFEWEPIEDFNLKPLFFAGTPS
jgi:hypothetical protein